MIHISLCMIVKNQEKVLSRCLDSVKNLVDEIVIVDTGSSDTTKEIAKRYTDKIFDFAWIDDFSAARNFAFSKAKNEYCMWLDADDVLQKEDSVRFLYMKETLPEDVEMVMMPYETAFNEDGKAIFSYYRERIIKNDVGFQFIGRVHEAIPRKGKVFYSEIPVKHRKEKRGYTDRNLKIYEKMEKEGEYFDPRALYYYGRELLAHRYYKQVEGTVLKTAEEI